MGRLSLKGVGAFCSLWPKYSMRLAVVFRVLVVVGRFSV